MTPQAYPANAFAVKLNDRGVKARVKLPCNMSSNRLGEETKHLNVSSDKECRQLGVIASNSCGYSSVGRASDFQSECRRFEPDCPLQSKQRVAPVPTSEIVTSRERPAQDFSRPLSLIGCTNVYVLRQVDRCQGNLGN